MLRQPSGLSYLARTSQGRSPRRCNLAARGHLHVPCSTQPHPSHSHFSSSARHSCSSLPSCSRPLNARWLHVLPIGGRGQTVQGPTVRGSRRPRLTQKTLEAFSTCVPASGISPSPCMPTLMRPGRQRQPWTGPAARTFVPRLGYACSTWARDDGTYVAREPPRVPARVPTAADGSTSPTMVEADAAARRETSFARRPRTWRALCQSTVAKRAPITHHTRFPRRLGVAH